MTLNTKVFMKQKKMWIMALLAAMSMSSPAQNASDIFAKNMDTNVRPQDDFFEYANGGWMKTHPMPDNYGRYTMFDVLKEKNIARINVIFQNLLKKKFPEGSVNRRMMNYYKLVLDTARREKEGLSPVKPLLNEIVAAPTKQALRALQIRYFADQLGVPFRAFLGADDKDVDHNILKLSQGGLTLRQKNYYVENDPATTAVRQAYLNHMKRMFALYGFNTADASKYAEAVLRWETLLALSSKANFEAYDPVGNYNKMSLSDFKKRFPNILLEKCMSAEGLDSKYFQTLIVGHLSFFTALNQLLPLESADELRATMLWSVIRASAPYLTDQIRQANFDFFGKVVSGRKADDALWQRAISQTESLFGEAMGHLYCDKYFPESSKKLALEMIRQIQKSYDERIDAQDWMSDSTKANAKYKVSTYHVMIGYPDKWKDYAGLEIDPAKSLWENTVAARNWAIRDDIARKAGKDVDRNQWGMYPQTVNAYYNSTSNTICFPAGILQYPFFDPKADAAFNYGAIGVVMGHEIGHGFDNHGSQYDAKGYLKDWWTSSDKANFKKRADAYAIWYDSIELLPGLFANGKYTNGENLADHGGLMASYNAYKNVTAQHPLGVKDGFTADQRFYLAFAGIYANHISEAELRNRTKTDEHSQGRWRVMGSLPHIDTWYAAFNVKPGDKMYLPEEKRVRLW